MAPKGNSAKGRVFFLVISSLALFPVALFLHACGIDIGSIGLFLVIMMGIYGLLAWFEITGLMLLIGSASALYLSLEIIVYLLLCAEVLRPDVASVTGSNLGGTSRPYVVFDTTCGYRYVPGVTHLVNIQQGDLVYEHDMPVNKQGFCSTIDYEYRKADLDKKRLLVFGDSYTAGEVADTAWPDLMSRSLTAAGSNTELYGFGLEGGGMMTWSDLFFKDIVPHYDFDGIMLAVYGDYNYYSSDLNRDYVIKHSGKTMSGLNFFPSLPKDRHDFDLNFEPQLCYDSNIYTDSELKHYAALLLKEPGEQKRFHLAPLRSYLLNYLADAYRFLHNRNAFKKRYGAKDIDQKQWNLPYDDLASVQSFYGPDKSERLKQMIDYCKQHNKEIWLVSIPSFHIYEEDTLNYHNNIYNRQLRCLSKAYGTNFVDGFAIFDGLNKDDYFRYELNHDSHWNRKGIDRFVACFTRQYLAREKEEPLLIDTTRTK